MAKAGFYDYVRTALSNADINGITTAENTMTPSQVNNALREFLKETADFVSDLGGVNQTVGGTANAMTVTLAATAAAITNGMRFTAFPTAANTSTTPTQTITPAVGSAFAAKTIKKYDGTGVLVALIPGDNAPGPREYLYLSSPDCIVLINPAQEARYAPGTLYGLTLSNNAGTPASKIDVAIGSARSGDDSANIDITSAITAKDITVAWAVGSSAGLLDTGAVANGRYYVWAIKRPDTGVTDVLGSASSTAPTMPTNYTLKTLIGEFDRISAVNGVPRYYSSATPGLRWEVAGILTPSAAASSVLIGLSAYRMLKVTGYITPATAGGALNLRMSTNNGSTYDSATNYRQLVVLTSSVAGAVTGAYSAANTAFVLSLSTVDNSLGVSFEIILPEFNQAKQIMAIERNHNYNGTDFYSGNAGQWYSGSTARNAIQITNSAGNISGFIVVEGLRG